MQCSERRGHCMRRSMFQRMRLHTLHSNGETPLGSAQLRGGGGVPREESPPAPPLQTLGGATARRHTKRKRQKPANDGAFLGRFLGPEIARVTCSLGVSAGLPALPPRLSMCGSDAHGWICATVDAPPPPPGRAARHPLCMRPHTLDSHIAGTWLDHDRSGVCGPALFSTSCS